MLSANRLVAALLCSAALSFMWAARAVFANHEYMMNNQPISKDSYDAGVLVNQGAALLRSNHNKEAADTLAQAVQLAPNLAEAHLDYGLALAKLSKSDDALQEFKLALNLNPGLDSAWLTMGALYQSSGQLANAIASYKEFLTRFPDNKDATKIASLEHALEKEYLLSKPTGDGKDPNDYFAQVTRNGVVRWPKSRMPIKVYIASGTGVDNYSPHFDELLRQSFADWAKASEGRIQFAFVDTPEGANIECRWIADAHSLVNPAESGETRLSKDGDGLLHGTLQLLTKPSLSELPMTDNRIRRITLHEIGHAIGLNGHTTDPHDAMFLSSTVEDQWKDLSKRDANTIIRLYSQP
jgi:tetratricopeptide (TPR) repeat protein